MSDEKTERLTALVRGRVQGVGFRAFAITCAQRRGLSGYARNLPDGRTVEIVAEGPRAALDALVQDLWRGPSGARVDAVNTSWSPAQGDLDSFDVRF